MNSSRLIVSFLVLALVGSAALSCAQKPKAKRGEDGSSGAPFPKSKSEAEWKKELTPEQFYVLRSKGTEAAFTGELWDNHESGVYHCAGCDQVLFDSSAKFESGTGWPSFWQPIAVEAVVVNSDRTLGMIRDEVVCSRCGGHLGHVFDDGPKPTGLRYCMNSVSMTFEKRK